MTSLTRCRRSDDMPTSSGLPLGTVAAVNDRASRTTATERRVTFIVICSPFRLLPYHPAAVDDDVGSGDEGRGRRSEKQTGGDNLGRLGEPPERNAFAETAIAVR